MYEGKIFLDMDGVLVDFVGGLFAKMRIAHLQEFILMNWPEDEFYIGKALRIPDPIFDYMKTVTDWVDLDCTPWCNDLISFCIDQVGEDNVYLLSSPGGDSWPAWSGKFLWVKKHLPKFKEKVILTRHKDLVVTQANWILVDDKEATIAKVNKAGGKGILCPAPWNSLRACVGNEFYVVEGAITDYRSQN